MEQQENNPLLKQFFKWLAILFIAWPIVVFIIISIITLIYVFVIGLPLNLIFNVDITSEGTAVSNFVVRILYPKGNILFYPLLPWKYPGAIFIIVLAIFIFRLIKKKFDKYTQDKFSKEQKAKGLIKYFDKWISAKEYKKILKKQKGLEKIAKKQQEEQQKQNEELERKRERKIEDLLSHYSAVCRDCLHAYHRRSSESNLCPKCGSRNIENN